jgi:hypothetical protein
MAEAIISPGVYTNENDQSAVTQGPIEAGAAIVGPTVNGIPYVPTLVTSYSDYIAKFGTTFDNGASGSMEYFTSLTAKNYFDNGGTTLLVTRITHQGTGSALEQFSSASVYTLGVNAASSMSVGGLHKDDGGTGTVALILTGSANGTTATSFGKFIMTGSTSLIDAAPIYYVTTGSTATETTNNIVSKINSLFSTFLTVANSSTTNLSVTASVLENETLGNSFRIVSSSINNAFTGGVSGTQCFEIETLAWGAQMNNAGSVLSSGALVSGSATNVRWQVQNVNTSQGTFTLVVRQGNDNSAQPNVLETWTNLSMDVNQPNYIARVIGNTKPVYTYSAVDGQGFIDYIGDFPNASRYIRIANVPQAQYGTFDNNGTYQSALFSGSLPVNGSGSLAGAFNGGQIDTSLPRFMYENIVSGVSNAQGFTTDDYFPAINLLNNSDEYRFNLLLTPGLFLAGGNSNINIGANGADPIALCEGRADALAVVDPVPYGGTVTGAKTAANASNSSYAATYWPWCQVFSSAMGKLVWVPASVLMGGVFAFTDQVSAPWFAPAGITRGGIPNVVKVERRLSLNDRNNLYLDNVNPLATFPGNGVVVFGQKTLQQKATALDRVNVRRLLIALKGYISGVARTLVFEQNTAVTRNKFLNQVNPYLDSVVQRQGLYAFKVIMDESNNTPSVVDRNQLVGQIYLQPTKTAEFVILDFTILPTGVEFPSKLIFIVNKLINTT